MIPLACEGEGRIRLLDRGRIEITAPETIDLEGWLATLPARLAALDLSGVRRQDPDGP